MASIFRRSRWTRFLLVAAALLVLGGVAGSIGFYGVFLRDLPDPHSVGDYRPALASTVVDRQGRPIGEFFQERRRLVRFDEVPRHLVDAFVSAEDSTFFEHEGIDFQSILRAAWKNLLAGDKVEGASTITQQMVKGLLLSPERTYTRKIREMILARRIERRFTKQEILYLYLNQIYFGHGAHGVGEAARSYFDKTVSELTVSEAAQLAGLPKAPSRYSPLRNPERAERRRRYVLRRMRDEGVLDEGGYQEALADVPEFVDGSEAPDFRVGAYFTEEVRRFLFDELGSEAVLEGGLRIETTLDLDLQAAAVAAVQDGLEALDHRNGYRGALRRVEPSELEAEIDRLALENGLVPADGEDAAGEGKAGEADAADAGRRVAELEADARPLGVVTEVNRQGALARVALGAGLRGVVQLEDTTWARPANPDTLPREVDRIEKVFSVGDVARFEVVPDETETGDAASGGGEELRLRLFQDPRVEGALISLDVATGDIVALVGGYDFARSEFNRATQARRQPGSAFKPLVYGAALGQSDDGGQPRYTPASIIHDRPKVYRDRRSGFVWKPQNYGREFYGPITLRTALSKSVNNASVHLCDEVGVAAVVRYAQRLGIHSPLERSLALALGTSGVSLLELTRAYAVFPNAGRNVVPRFLVRVLDRDGEVLLENVPLGDPLAEPDAEVAELADAAAGSPDEVAEAGDALAEGADGLLADRDEDEQLIPPEQAFLMTDLLRAVVREGTGRRALVLGRPLAGKTGTTNDQADAWFVGFSPEIATGVWVGFDESRFLGAGETGARAALPIWIDYMGAALADRPKRDFPVPGNRIVWARIDRETGLLATRQSKATVFQPFLAGTEPTRTAAAAREDDRARQDLREDSFGF